MKKNRILSIVLILVFCFADVSLAASNSIGVAKKAIKINNQNKTVNVVTVDLNSPDIELGVSIANDKVGGSEDFLSMIKRKKAAAAINANFFDAYKTLEPYGGIMMNKEIVYLESSPASMTISDKGKVDIGKYKIEINGYLDGFRENEWNNEKQDMDYYLFEIWYVNQVPRDPEGVYLFTKARGDKVKLNGGIAIEVVKDKVTKITKNAKEAKIPKDGYIIYYGNSKGFASFVDDRFKIGQTVELEYEIAEESETSVKKPKKEEKIIKNSTEIESMISAGPLLVQDGKIVFNPKTSGFTENKIIKDRGQRSAIGITKSNKLLLVTGSNLNMNELSKVMVELGAVKAMNLDGGASSGLYAKGNMITNPGRKLNTVLMIYNK